MESEDGRLLEFTNQVDTLVEEVWGVDRRKVDRQVEKSLVVHPRSLPSKEKERVVMQLEFDQDLGESMVFDPQGYDPYHHVGKYVVAECIGIDLC